MEQTPLTQNTQNWKQKTVARLLEKNILVDAEFLEQLGEEDLQKIADTLAESDFGGELFVLNAETHLQFLQRFEEQHPEQQQSWQQPVVERHRHKGAVNITFSYEEKSKKRETQDFVSFFNARYNKMRKLLTHRPELQGIISINRISGKHQREHVSIIGMINDIRTTKNNNLVLQVEDNTGSVKVLVSQHKPELWQKAKDIVLDEVIGVQGTTGENILFANALVLPDIPNTKELRKASEEAYAVFLSDLHVGSKLFLEEEFHKFLKWINQEAGNERQREIAAKVQYVFVAGDLVDGIGIYPSQEHELAIKDIYAQYAKCAELLSHVPQEIQLILSPGNHDAMRISEPQPRLYKDFAKPLWELPNVTMISNPGMVNIHATGTSPGFDVLVYHGYSFDHYIATMDSIRSHGGYDRPDIIMKLLLQKRHLAPTHTSTLYIPDAHDDPLVIDRVPDFFITGHLHKSAVANYKNITLICSSCWQAKTAFQAKMGHNPEPARVPIANLKTREVKLLRF
ncbi:DNA-directed DNA polymerase II small subunit [Candidatus Woesearchaeota archaeon]|nr:DNA-directed DNA polymerase II small subunit [Candidatus Woesearchaeota archaeon]